MTPVRIQRKRTKDWKMPPNTVSVCRPGMWGNGFAIGKYSPIAGCTVRDAAHAVELFRTFTMQPSSYRDLAVSALRGKNLACFCKVGDPCHGDVLLEIANGTETKA